MLKLKKKFSVLLIVLLALSFFSAAVSAENILGNGEFIEDIKTINNVTDNGGGNFATEDNWLFLENAGAGVGEIDNEMFKVSVFEGGSNTYSIQLLQAPVEIKKGYKYKVEFDAKASKPRELEFKVGGTEGRGWGSYVGGKGETGGFVAELDREMKSYEYEFVMIEDTDPKSRVEFQLGKQTGTIWLDNVSLTEVGEASADEIPEEQKKKWVYNKDFFFIFNVAVGGNLGGQVDTDFPKEMLVDYIKVYDQDGNLDWEDDFDGEEVNEDYWTYEVGNGHKQGIPGWGNNELQYYTEGENAHVEDSNLVITVREEQRSDQYGEYDYTSTRMITQDKVNMKYGRVEIRAKLSEGQGLWPAFWMLGSDITENPWPGSGEIDMMEFIAGQTDEVHGTVHGPNHYGGGGITQHYVLDEGDFTDGYHDFIFEWTPDEMRWYIDDDQEPYHVVERTDDNQAQRGGNPEEPEYTKNAVVNGEFNSSILDKMSSSPDNWYVWTGEGGAVSDYGVEDGEFKIDVSSLGNQTWAIQFAQYVDLDAGDYRLSFEARADAERDIIAMVQEDGGDWKVYGEAQPTLTSEMKKYIVDVSLAAADIPKLLFSLGNTDNGETTAVYIDNVKLEKLN
ncbi:family 16 glycosylhydrolase [Halanaerobium saccharolyticum]|uniref:family 16 glycosylhydrolase n=1 Tax=Halanaerobium saccharolyticum TaxID=43595 RepID=UPI003FCDB610